MGSSAPKGPCPSFEDYELADELLEALSRAGYLDDDWKIERDDGNDKSEAQNITARVLSNLRERVVGRAPKGDQE